MSHIAQEHACLEKAVEHERLQNLVFGVVGKAIHTYSPNP